jgi:KDO2-lipid IV(A) lauroyltransferase
MPRQIGALKARVEYVGIAALARGLAAIPLERAVRFGAALGDFVARIDRFNRPIAMRNLAIAFPEKSDAERRAIVRGMYRNLGRMLAEFTHFSDLDRGNIERYVTYDTRENLNRALELAEGRGALIVTAHYGNFELLALAHSAYGYRLAIVQRPLRNPLIAKLVNDARTRMGNQIITRKKGGRAIFSALRENRHVAIALDLDVRHGVFVDFFGMKASTSDGVARLAAAASVPVVPAFMVREGDSPRHRIVVLPVVEMASGGDREACVVENTQRITKVIEEMIRRHPDHWNWIHRRWKTRPPGEKRFY